MDDASEVATKFLSDQNLRPSFDDLTISTPPTVPLIPDGKYDAVCLSCRKERRFKRNALVFKFKIASQGAHLGAVIDGYVNLDFGRGKTCVAPPRSKLARWLRVIANFDSSVSTKVFALCLFGRYQFIVLVEASAKSWRAVSDPEQDPCEPTSRVTEIIDVVGRVGRPN